jgi:hypothetical protein
VLPKGQVLNPGRTSLWLPLLERLTGAAPSWGVWKSPESAFESAGDVDALASQRDWEVVLETYRSWALERRLGPVIACTHIPDLLVLVACEADRLLQMDVYSHRAFRGPRLASAGALGPLMQLDERGFRRLRPGAEGLLLFLAAGVRPGGRPTDAGTTARVASLLRTDPEGVEEAARALGKPGKHALAAARAVASGDWNRGALLRLEARSVLRLLSDPRELATCLVRDARRLRPCALIEALEAGRRVPADAAEWLREIGRSHAVYNDARPELRG